MSKNYKQLIMSNDTIAGVDEAGRGPLAGPVVAAAVILNFDHTILGLNDSKKLSSKRRDILDLEIRQNACWCIAMATVDEIDYLNIHNATLLAMRRAVIGLTHQPLSVIVDGKFVPELPMPAIAKIGGDAIYASISAASIVAKQARDRLMVRLHGLFPEYGFDSHKGYPTRAHLGALDQYGPLSIHRRSYAPIKQRLYRA
jgi:ribonuclease HII